MSLTIEEINRRLPILQRNHEAYEREEEIRDSDWPKPSPYAKKMREYERAKEFIELGQEVDDHPQGLLVNNKFIIARKQKKWRVQGKNTWYWYSDVPTFVKKYILREE